MTIGPLPSRPASALAVVLLACSWHAAAGDEPSLLGPPKIDRRPAAPEYSPGKLTRIPKYDPDSGNPFQLDLRSAVLSELDLRESGRDLAFALFDSRTVWPPAERMPAGFDPARVLELGRNPGLGVRALHARGITGRGVSLAIVDQPLIVDHPEYGERLRLYEEVGMPTNVPCQMHGPAVASIAVGKTCGVAPGADLFFIAAFAFDAKAGRPKGGRDFTWYAQAVRRLVEINRQLPPERKIRALSLSIGWDPSEAGCEAMRLAVRAARDAGMLVTSSSIEETHGVHINGLGRPPLGDPDRFESYSPGLFWGDGFPGGGPSTNELMMPMDSRTVASFTGTNDYAFYRQGGWSWITPYLAATYALAVQVKPDLTPAEFLSLALKTGRTLDYRAGSKTAPLGILLDPEALIRALERK
jgi:subtilisin family serine protease